MFSNGEQAGEQANNIAERPPAAIAFTGIKLGGSGDVDPTADYVAPMPKAQPKPLVWSAPFQKIAQPDDVNPTSDYAAPLPKAQPNSPVASAAAPLFQVLVPPHADQPASAGKGGSEAYKAAFAGLKLGDISGLDLIASVPVPKPSPKSPYGPAAALAADGAGSGSAVSSSKAVMERPPAAAAFAAFAPTLGKSPAPRPSPKSPFGPDGPLRAAPY